jgi:hypothetical protein
MTDLFVLLAHGSEYRAKQWDAFTKRCDENKYILASLLLVEYYIYSGAPNPIYFCSCLTLCVICVVPCVGRVI